MNAAKHCKISVKRWGGQASDYYDIHDFIDSTKPLCSDGRHRILHTLWGVKTVIVAVFGHSLINSDGKEVDIKDMCERDHLLVDFGNKYIPTLEDFSSAINDDEIKGFEKKIEDLHSTLTISSELSNILLSPLSVTGQLKSLLFTHNSWFINSILPLIFRQTDQDFSPILQDFSVSPGSVFNAMNFENWMDNGICCPPSAEKLLQRQLRTH